MKKRPIRLGATALVLALSLGGPAAAFAQEPSSTAPSTPTSSATSSAAAEPELDVEASASFDKTAYDAGDSIRIKLTIKNVSGVVADGVIVFRDAPHDLIIEESTWGDARPGRTGVRIEPGAAHVLDLTGRVSSSTAGSVEFNSHVVTGGGPERNYENNKVSLKAPLTHGHGRALATVYGDANGNGRFDDGEAVKGVKVELRRANPPHFAEQTSDGDGRVVFADLPGGAYEVRYQSADGWLPHPDFREDRWVVEPNKELVLVRPVVRPVADKLQSAIRFHQSSYSAGDTLRLTVTLTNNGPVAIPSVRAFCSGPGEPGEIQNGDGWGPLSENGSGVPVGAGETKTVEVTNAITDGMVNAGVAEAYCDFGPDPLQPGASSATARTKVLGAVGNGKGRLLDGENGLAHMKIVLMDEVTGSAAARATTDADGHFTFTGVPTGRYIPVVVGPWKVVTRNQAGGIFRIYRDPVGEQNILVEPGPDVADPDAVPPAPNAPQGGNPSAASADGDLASTGASVTGLIAVGLALSAAGVGAVVAVRRKKPLSA